MPDTIRLSVEGIDDVIKNMDAIGPDLPPYMRGAGQEVSRDLLSVRGLQNYPPATEANFPPPPYYIRGRGMQTSASRNDGRSKRLGTKWEVRPRGQLGTEIRNPVDYAEHVHGIRQARAMAAIGWLILYDTALERVGRMTEIYDRWVGKLLRKHGLK